jgi:Domain of unknown function (DUF4852)
LYWKAGLLRFDNERALTEYIQVSSCDLYHKTYQDDFAWPETLKKTAAYLRTYHKRFANQFVIIQPLALGRYLPDKGYFQITEDTQYRDLTRLEFANFLNTRSSCDRTQLPRSAPLKAIVTFALPITIDKIQMSADQAKQAIAFIDGRKKAAEINNDNYRRFAYVYFYISINGFNRVDEGTNLQDLLLGPSLDFTGTLDGFKIFADLEGTTPLMMVPPQSPPTQP